MKALFWILAGAMLLGALAVLLLPLIRHGRRLGRPRGVFALVLVLAFVLPLASVGLYALVGTPAALDAHAPAGAQGIDDALTELRAHLTQHPDDVQGWQLLGQTMAAMQRPVPARDAYGHALALDPHEPIALVGWAEADSMAGADHRIGDLALDRLARAAALQPDNQRALWLLGIGQYQRGRYPEAAASWRRLRALLPTTGSVATAVVEQIALADARGKAVPAATSSVLHVQVAIAPALAGKFRPGDTLFVYARAENGSPMPLAVARQQADRLPREVVLTDAMSMLPGRRLSSAQRVRIGARISRRGDATAHAGDLEGDAGVIGLPSKAPVPLTIDRVHP